MERPSETNLSKDIQILNATPMKTIRKVCSSLAYWGLVRNKGIYSPHDSYIVYSLITVNPTTPSKLVRNKPGTLKKSSICSARLGLIPLSSREPSPQA